MLDEKKILQMQRYDILSKLPSRRCFLCGILMKWENRLECRDASTGSESREEAPGVGICFWIDSSKSIHSAKELFPA